MENNSVNVFIDADVFIGAFNKDDALHEKTTQLWQDLFRRRARLFTSTLVLAEALTVLRYKAGKKESIKFGDTLLKKTKSLEIIYLNELLLNETYDLFSKIETKDISFTDALTITLGRKFNFEVASFDKKLKNQIKN